MKSIDFSNILPKGSVLVFSLLILSIMLVTSLTILSSAVLDRKASLSTGSSTRSFQVADSGVEEVLYQIYKNAAAHNNLDSLASAVGGNCVAPGTIEFPVAGGTAKVIFYQGETTVYNMACNANDNWRDNIVKIKSEGTAGSTTRAVEVAVAGSGLECVQATRRLNNAIDVYYDDGTTATGDTAEITSPGTGPGSLWGLECLGAYKKTGCYMSNVPGAGVSQKDDWDIHFDPTHLQGCFTDNDEFNSDSTMAIVCCR